MIFFNFYTYKTPLVCTHFNIILKAIGSIRRDELHSVLKLKKEICYNNKSPFLSKIESQLDATFFHQFLSYFPLLQFQYLLLHY